MSEITLQDLPDIPMDRIVLNDITLTRPVVFRLLMGESLFMDVTDERRFGVILEIRESPFKDAVEVDFEKLVDASLATGVVDLRWLYEHRVYGLRAPSGSKSYREAFEWLLVTALAKPALLDVRYEAMSDSLEFDLVIKGKGVVTTGTVLFSKTDDLFHLDRV